MATRLTSGQEKRCNSVFTLIDVLNRGWISLEDARKGLAGLGVRDDALSKLPPGQLISQADFALAYAQGLQKTPINHQTLGQAFKTWDTSGSRSMSMKEVRHLVMKDGLPVGITEADIEAVLVSMDSNGDGRITQQELFRLLVPRS
eukprot:m.359104 g.359104  ORF g.359104 m.359104 type:complete len:146 (+) comp18413_c0_seq1:212-649(+)